jgi:hypothetical protein
MKVFTNSFKFHVDAKHFGFQWTEAMYIDVTYSAFIKGDKSEVAITNVSAPLFQMTSIVIHDNWLIVCEEMQKAAEANFAKVAPNGHVNPTVLNSIAYFIRP